MNNDYANMIMISWTEWSFESSNKITELVLN